MRKMREVHGRMAVKGFFVEIEISLWLACRTRVFLLEYFMSLKCYRVKRRH